MKKWEIYYISRFPECIPCKKCHRSIMPETTNCPHCHSLNRMSNLVAKIRPIILWSNQKYWKESMAFGIPLSKTNPIVENDFNQPILMDDYSYLYSNEKYHNPMRALIHQSTRIDGNVLSQHWLLGEITNDIVKQKIDNKLFNWIFPD